MYAEVSRVARLYSNKYWPLPAPFDREGIEREMLGSGWQADSDEYVLPAQNDLQVLRVVLEPCDLIGVPWQSAAALAGLAALAAARIPMRATIRLSLAEQRSMDEESLFLASGCGCVEMAAEQGLLVVFAPGSADGLVRISYWPLLSRAREALSNAGFHPHLALRSDGHAGLGFVAPGRPDGGREEMARAVQAYAGLLYGLAGYGVMAFDFDLDL